MFVSELDYTCGLSPVSNKSITRHHALLATARVGYKYQSLQGGFIFKIGFTPYYLLYMSDAYEHTAFLPTFGISFGF